MSASTRARDVARRAAGPLAPYAGRSLERKKAALAESLIERQLEAHPEIRTWYDAMTDEDARRHFGEDEIVDVPHLRSGLRYFHAWRIHKLRTLLGEWLESASFLDVGDTDGLILKHLGQRRLGFNLSPAAVRNIESNGIEAKLGDGQDLPFGDGEFEYVLCFETLEHVESPARLLSEMARVAAPEGRVFVSIPWVPRTFVHSRDRSIDRGYGHVFEFCRDDFAALLSHTPLEIASEDICELLGPAGTLAQRTYRVATARRHIVAGGFRSFQFFELAHRS